MIVGSLRGYLPKTARDHALPQAHRPRGTSTRDRTSVLLVLPRFRPAPVTADTQPARQRSRYSRLVLRQEPETRPANPAPRRSGCSPLG